MRLATKPPLALSVLLWASLAMAQSNLGELLDAGARKLTPEEFRQEVVQHLIVGKTASGGTVEVMYTANGMVQGVGSYAAGYWLLTPVSGNWTIDENDRVCTSMRIGGPGGGGAGVGATLPSRCQLWFKLAEQYFLSDSDSDRRTRVLSRTLKQ